MKLSDINTMLAQLEEPDRELMGVVPGSTGNDSAICFKAENLSIAMKMFVAASNPMLFLPDFRTEVLKGEFFVWILIH